MNVTMGVLILGVLLFILGAILMTVILPAYDPELREAQLAAQPLSPQAEQGRQIYIREGCWGCHSQQVRSIEHEFGRVQVPGDIGPGSVPGDMALQRPGLLGTQRRGPDLAWVGDRLPSREWHMLHHRDPRAFFPTSIMPPYRYLSDEELEALAVYMISLRTDIRDGGDDP